MILSRILKLAPVLALGALVACGSLPSFKPYRIELQQGNWISQDMVAKLKPGMTKNQVRFILGTPLLVDPFHADRWDYVYTHSPVNSTAVEQRSITVFFKDDRLDRVTGDVVAAARQNAAADAASSPAARQGEAE